MKRYMAILIIGCLAGLLTVIAGCSKNELIVDSGGAMSGSGITAYFPLNNGYTTQFQMKSASGDTWVENFTVGGSVLVQSGIATMRLKQSASGNDTGYFRTTDSALYYFSNSSAPGEKILELPLVVGNNWERIASNNGSDTGNGGTNPDTSGTTNGGGGASSPSHFPTTGSNIMTVTNVETITLSNGYVFSGAVQICTAGADGTQNQYWFAPGVGLVKYVLGASGFLSTANGDEVGELVDYWK